VSKRLRSFTFDHKTKTTDIGSSPATYLKFGDFLGCEFHWSVRLILEVYFFTNKSGSHDIADILREVTLHINYTSGLRYFTTRDS